MSGIGPTNFSVDAEEQINALSLGDTFEKNPSLPSLIEGIIYHLTAHGFTAGSFCIRIMDKSSLVCEVFPDWIHLVLPVSN
jgi:hypothetical protein